MRCLICEWVRRWPIRWLCGDMMWNAEASREIDRLRAEVERLREGG